MEEQVGEGGLRGEGASLPSPHFLIEEIIHDKKLLFDEASVCLNTLGKDESGVRYAYLMISANDKKLTEVAIILNFKHVLFVDLCGNYLNLEALQVLAGMPFLIYLKADRNKVDSAALSPMPYLQVLILNKNQITETCDINQPTLEYLHLDDNLIYTAQFDSDRLEHLKVLGLKGNHLLDLSGQYPHSIEQLYLAQNRISKFTIDFSTLSNLKVLHLRDNHIKKLNGFTEQLEHLTYLNLRGNNITKVRQFRKLMCLPNLETLIYLDNPVYQVEEEKIDEMGEEEAEGEEQAVSRDKSRIPVLVLLPKLKRINKEMVILEERDAAEVGKRKITEAIFEEMSSEDETELPTTTDFTTDYTTETEMDKDFDWQTDNEDAGKDISKEEAEPQEVVEKEEQGVSAEPPLSEPPPMGDQPRKSELPPTSEQPRKSELGTIKEEDPPKV